MRRYITAAIGLLFILFYCSGCGPSYHLRRAQHHIKKAELKGAVWSRDTLFKKLNLKVPGIKVEFEPRILTSGKPMIFIKDSVRTEVLIKSGKNGVDTVYVDTKCPDSTIEEKVPVAINNKIEAGQTFWQKAGIFFLVFLAGVAVGIWIWAGPAKNVTINLKNEKPPS